MNTALPTISGQPVLGQTLTANSGSWRNSPISYAYQWRDCTSRGCTSIAGATGSTDVLRPADVGDSIDVVVTAANASGSGTATSAQTTVVSAAADTTPPTAPSNLSATSGDGQVSLTWSGSTDPDSAVAGYDVLRNGTQVAQVIGTTYADTGLTNGTSYSYYVTAYDAAGNVSSPSNTVSATPSVQSSGGGNGYFATVPSSETGYPPLGYPQSDANCAAEVRPTAENRPDNTAANHTAPTNPSSISWSPDLAYWSKFIYDRNLITGNYTGTTDEILQWTACKWGIDENIIRAAAAQESWWHQSTVGDNCGIAGEASYGILQVKNKDCSGGVVHGGWPDTQNETALDADYYAARLRACFDGAFYDGGAWLYGGQTIAQVIAARGEDYALWGCVGSWYSGNWYDSGAQSYITSVQNYYTTKPWLSPGF